MKRNADPAGVGIRPAEAADRLTLLAMVAAITEAERALHPSRRPALETAETYLDGLLAAGSTVLLAEAGAVPVGLVAGRLVVDEDAMQTMAWRRYGYVSDLYVAAAWRGRGLGLRLLGEIEAALAARGAKRLRICALAVNEDAIRAYHAFGFVPFEIDFDKPLP